MISFIGNSNIYRENKKKVQSTPKKLWKGSIQTVGGDENDHCFGYLITFYGQI